MLGKSQAVHDHLVLANFFPIETSYTSLFLNIIDAYGKILEVFCWTPYHQPITDLGLGLSTPHSKGIFNDVLYLVYGRFEHTSFLFYGIKLCSKKFY